MFKPRQLSGGRKVHLGFVGLVGAEPVHLEVPSLRFGIRKALLTFSRLPVQFLQGIFIVLWDRAVVSLGPFKMFNPDRLLLKDN